MGSYASLYISDFEFYSYKSAIEHEVMTLFRESDKKRLDWKDDDGEERVTYKYSNTVRNIKLRLDIMGFNLDKAKEEFITYNNVEESFSVLVDNKFVELDFEGYNFYKWLDTLGRIANKPFNIWEQMRFPKDNKQESIMEHYILNEHHDGESLFGFKSTDFRFVLRAVLEIFEDGEECSIDYSDLIDGGYYEESDEIAKSSLEYLYQKTLSNQKILILTEGSTDISIIKETMSILYPDVRDYYSFMDFNNSNAPGSASALVNSVKAFIGSGINNKIIALFDNDTAAYDAAKQLKKIQIPSNIKVLHYPNIEIAKKYPTLGPISGTTLCDINGLACSIELYLGEDILLNESEEFTPIQWKGYNQSLKQYQGEILNKEQLIKNYLQLLKDVETGSVLMSYHDWTGMEKILQMIFTAFDLE